jgi:hypothetical protein
MMDLDKKIDFSKVTGEFKRFGRWLKVNDHITRIIIQPFAFLGGMVGSNMWITKGDFTLNWWSVSIIATLVWCIFITGLHYIGYKIVQRKESKKQYSNPFDC